MILSAKLGINLPRSVKKPDRNFPNRYGLTLDSGIEENAGMLNEKSAIHKAFSYTMKRYKRLSVYMENGALNIDNNPIEGSIRGIALGRKNFLFCGSHEGAQRSAMLYSFMGTYKLQGINLHIFE